MASIEPHQLDHWGPDRVSNTLSIGDVLTAEHLACGRRAAWADHLAAEFNEPYMGELRERLLGEERSQRRILPEPRRIYEALDETTPDEVKVVILGQDPYREPGQAHGLSFSVEQGARPMALAKLFAAIKRDLGEYPGGISNRGEGTDRRSCLTPWARQGVLLLNTALTVREGCAGAHIGWGWEQFTSRIIEAVANVGQPVVLMLWGKEAQRQPAHVGNQHLVLCGRHPRTGLVASARPFSQCNEYLHHHGREPIDWLDVCSRPPANAQEHIAPLTAADAADEAHWDRQFARSHRFLAQLADEATREQSQGQTEALDPTRW